MTEPSFKSDCTTTPTQSNELSPTPANHDEVAEFDPNSPGSLLTVGGLRMFLTTTTRSLRRRAPKFLPECADEAAEDAAMAVQRDPDGFDSMARVVNYARKALRHGAERSRKLRSLELSLDDALDLSDTEILLYGNPDPETLMIERERLTQRRSGVIRAWLRLSQTQRTAVLLHGVSGLPYKQVSEMTLLAESTLYNSYSKALKKLRQLLSTELPIC